MKNQPEIERDSDQTGRPDPGLAMVASLSQLISGADDLSELIHMAVGVVFKALECVYCRVLLLEPDGATFLVAGSAGVQNQGDDQVSRLPRANTLADLALKTSHPVVIDGASLEERPTTGLPGEPEVKAISVAMAGQMGTFGVFETYFKPDRIIQPADIDLTWIAANILSVCVDRDRIKHELGKLDERFEQTITQRTEWIQLLSETTVAANEAATVAEAMQTVLTKVCLYTRWPVGHVYIPARDTPASLQPTPVWFTRDPERYHSFIQATQITSIPIGTSLPGKVLETGKPVWVVDISKKGFLRATEAELTGLKAAFAFPVLVQKEVVAVMEFFTDQTIPADHPLLDVVANIGIQVGRVIERRRAQEELETNQRQLAEAHRIARLGTWEWDILMNKLTWSDRLFEILGRDQDKLGTTYEDYLAIVHPDDRAQIKEIIERALAYPAPFEFQHRIARLDGEVRVLHVRGDVITDLKGNPVKMFGTGQDVTRRKQIEADLQAREEMLHTVITAAPIILWAVDRQGKITLMEGMGLAAIDTDPRGLLGKSISEVVGDRKEILDYIQRALAGEQVVTEMEAEGAVFETRFAPMLDKNKEIVGVTGISLDVTSRVRAEVARRASDARFRTIFDGSAIGIGIINLDHQLLVTNPVFQQMLGLSAEEIQHKQIEQLIHPQDRAKSHRQLENLLAGAGPLMHQEVRFLRQDQSLIWTGLSASFVRNPNGSPNFAIIMLEDITSRKQIEAELIEIQQQLVAGGEKERLHLAQEIHDDPLQNLYGLLYQLDSVREEVQSEHGLMEIREMQAGINQVINSLRGICRGLRPPTLMPFGLEVSIREHADSFQKEHPELRLHLDLMYDGQSLPEHIRLTLFRIYQQALSNVARHAQASNVNVWFRFDDRQAELVVEDDGRGFTVPRRWVEYVRKNHMGLAGSAERVEILNGSFQVNSSPDNGTRIEARVPRNPANHDDNTPEGDPDGPNWH